MTSAPSNLTLAVSALLIVAGCGESPSGNTAGGTTTAAEGSLEEGTAGSAQPQTASSLWRGGEQTPLDIQVAHPNGVVLQLTSLQSRETETVIGVRVINGEDHEIHLNRFNNRDGYIVMGSGERLYLSPPPGNAQLSIQPGQTLEGELVFLGRLPPAQSAILVLNENNSTDSQHTRTPGFRIDLPLANPAASGAVS